MGKDYTDTANRKSTIDQDSVASLAQMSGIEQVSAHRLQGINLVLIVLSARGMAFDLESLRQKVVSTYPDAAVFFQTSMGKPVGPKSPDHVDLLLDFTGPTERQGFFYSKKLRRMSKIAVGRNAGWFRKKIYDRVFDEKNPDSRVPTELLQREQFIQKKLLNLAGIPVVHTNDTPPDRGKVIALELPSMQRA